MDVTPYVSEIEKVAASFVRRLPTWVDRAEIRSVAYLALVEAGGKYDDEKSELPFIKYAAWLTRLRILDYVRRECYDRKEVPVWRKLQKAEAELEEEFGCEPDPEDVRIKAGLSVKDYRRYVMKTGLKRAISLETPIGEDGEGRLQDVVAAETEDPRAFDHKDIFDRMRDAVNSLPEKERYVIMMYYFEGMNMAQVAEAFNITESRVSQICANAITNLRSRFQVMENRGVLPVAYTQTFGRFRLNSNACRPIPEDMAFRIRWTDGEIEAVRDKFLALYSNRNGRTILSLLHTAEESILPTNRRRKPQSVESYGTRLLGSIAEKLPGVELIHRRGANVAMAGPPGPTGPRGIQGPPGPMAPVQKIEPRVAPAVSIPHGDVMALTQRILESIDLVTRNAFAALGIAQPALEAPSTPKEPDPVPEPEPVQHADEAQDDPPDEPQPEEPETHTAPRTLVDFSARKKVFVFGISAPAAQQFRENILKDLTGIEVVFISPESTVPRASCDYSVFVASTTPAAQVEGARVQFGSTLACVNKVEDLVSFLRSTDAGIRAAASG